MKSPWLVRHTRRARPRARLFCFPYAGSGASAYRLWPKGLPEELDVCLVQPPGREDRFREPPLRRIAALIEGLLPSLEAELDLPFAFFGHSMGAVFASEVARALQAKGAPLPKHLVVSARRPPHLQGAETPLNHLSDAEFLTEVQRRYGGIPTELLNEPEVMALLLPCLRADIEVLETHRPAPRPPFPFPISAFGGALDELTPRDHLEAWRGETTGPFRVRVFPGGHFYIAAHRNEVLADLTATFAPILTAQADAPAG